MTDTDRIRAVLRESYATISGPAGERDWARHAHYFVDDARLLVVHRRPEGDVIESLTVEQYRASRDPFFRKNTFYETEASSDVILHGDLALAMSHYESRWALTDPPFETGTNSVQLVRIGGEWRIASIMWHAGLAAQRVLVSGD
jgi:hypothetical protein